MANSVTVFLEMIVPQAKLLQRSIAKGFLIVKDELFSVFRLKRL